MQGGTQLEEAKKERDGGRCWRRSRLRKSGSKRDRKLWRPPVSGAGEATRNSHAVTGAGGRAHGPTRAGRRWQPTCRWQRPHRCVLRKDASRSWKLWMRSQKAINSNSRSTCALRWRSSGSVLQRHRQRRTASRTSRNIWHGARCGLFSWARCARRTWSDWNGFTGQQLPALSSACWLECPASAEFMRGYRQGLRPGQMARPLPLSGVASMLWTRLMLADPSNGQDVPKPIRHGHGRMK